MNKIIAFLKLCRIQNIYLAFLDSLGVYLAIIFLGPSNIIPPPLVFIGGIQVVVISSLLWASGIILNDVFDIEKDRKLFPTRVLVQNLVSIYNAKHLALVLQTISILVCVASPYSIVATPLLIILIGLIYLYNRVKEKGFLAALTMGLCRASNCAYAGVIAFIFLKTGEVNIRWIEIIEQILYFSIYPFFTIFIITLLSLYEDKKIHLPSLMGIPLLLMIPFMIQTLSPLLLAACISSRRVEEFVLHTLLLYILFTPLFLIPTFIYKKIDILGLLHYYVSGIYLLWLWALSSPLTSSHKPSHYKWFPIEIVCVLVLAYYIRKFFLKGIFSES